jgi:hypothetical protein
MNARAYLRASTDGQDASRAKSQVEAFVAERGLDIVGWFVEKEIVTHAFPPLLKVTVGGRFRCLMRKPPIVPAIAPSCGRKLPIGLGR